MRTSPQSNYRQQNAPLSHGADTADQQRLSRKRKNPESILVRDPESDQIALPKPTLKIKLKLNAPKKTEEKTSDQNDSRALVDEEKSTNPMHSKIRLRFKSSEERPSATDKPPIPTVVATAVVPEEEEVIMASIAEHAVGTAAISSAEDALININHEWLESSEPALKRRKIHVAKKTEPDDIEPNPDTIENILREHQEDIRKNSAEAFYTAVNNNDAEALEHCILYGSLNIQDIKEKNVCQMALLMMLGKGNHQAVTALIRQGICTKFLSGQEGIAHLNWTIKRGHWRTVRVLLGSATEHGELHSTLIKFLHDAMCKPDYAAVKTLLRAGMSGCQINASGKTSLELLVKAFTASVSLNKTSGLPVNPDYFRIIGRLINAGININQRVDQFGSTLLHKAMEFGYSDYADWLVSKGANPEAKNIRQQTPRDVASAMRERPYQENILDGQGHQFDPSLLVARQPHSVFTLDRAVMPPTGNHGVQRARNLNPSTVRQGDLPPAEARALSLSLALLQGNDTLAKRLLSEGVDPWTDMSGSRKSALEIAATKGRIDILSQILARNDFEPHKGLEGVDALCAAVGAGQVEAARRLVSKGVPRFSNGSQGKSAMSVLNSNASARENTAMVSVLFASPAELQ